MKIQISFLVMVIYILTYVNSQRLIESKCSEYSQIPMSSSNPLPHIALWITRLTTKGNTSYTLEQVVYVILISDKFLLGNRFNLDDGGFEKLSMNPQDHKILFTWNDVHIVREILFKPLNDERWLNIVLLRIDRISLDSNHRPACLWGRNDHLTGTVNFFLNGFIFPDRNKNLPTNAYVKHLFTSYTNVSYDASVCPNLNHLRKFCFKSDADIRHYSYNPYTPILHSFKPFNFLPNNYYIYGMLTSIYEDYRTGYNLAISSRFDWIETQVWETDVTTCGMATININPVILYSQPTLMEEFPWHAGIFYIEGNGRRDYKCGGALLNENTVVTAAHCVSAPTGILSKDILVVTLGKHNLNINSINTRETSVASILVHNSYDRNNYANDIAVLKLRTIMTYTKYIQPICITKNLRLFENPIGVLPGWGKNEFNQLQAVLAKGSYPIRQQSECRGQGGTMSALASFVNENNFCAGYQNGTSLCNGDSGGGLVFKVNDQWFLRGIASIGAISSGTGQCDPLELSLFTDVTQFYDWIVDKM